MTKFSRQIIQGLLASVALLVLCVAMVPVGLEANDGLSYYGSVWFTVVPYAGALLIYECALWWAAEGLGHNGRQKRLLAIALKLMAILVIGILLIPINIAEDFHSLIGLILFLVQFIVSLKLLAWGFNWIDVTLVIVEFLAGAAAIYYASGEHGWLLQSQVVFQIAFIALFMRSIVLVRNKSRRTKTDKPKRSR